MKKSLTVLCILALILPVIAGCTPGDPDVTSSPVTGEETTDTAAVTDEETEPEEEEVRSAVIKVTSLSVSDKIKVTYDITTAPEDLSGKLTVSAAAENGEVREKTLEPTGEAELEAPADGDVIMITLSFADGEGEVLDTAELRVKDGLILLTEDAVSLVVAEMTDDEKAHLIAGTGKPKKAGASGGTYEIERLGVPSITVNDGPAGVRYTTSVWYPSIMNITSSWDGELIYGVGGAIGRDSLALGIDIVLAPGMNIQKNVLGGRNFEYCSEDPLLTAFSASAYVNGMQAAGAGACLKHFAGNEQETNRGSESSTMTERALREIYLKPFQLTVKNASPWSIMSSYNQLNGAYASINKDLLTGILRDEWGYKGAVMSDWGSAGAVTDKVNAQNDLKMPGDTDDAKNMLAGIKNGKVDMTALDLCCEHILYTVTQTPTFKELQMNHKVPFTENGKIAAAAGADTLVLLKNENGALPYKAGTSVALFGNGAYKTVFGGSGSGGVSPKKTVTIAKGISSNSSLSLYDEKNNIFRRAESHSKTSQANDKEVSVEYAEKCAEGADTAVIVISRDSSEGADNSPGKGDYLLNDREYDMVKRVSDAFHAKNKTVVVLINTGSAIEVASWRDLVDGIIFIGYPGQGAGDAVAAVLSGEVNPSAKTTMSWPLSYSDTPAHLYFPGNPGKAVYYEDIYVGYRYYGTFGVDVAYPFGYGLSYTEFEYSGFTVKENKNGTFTAKLTVKNTGNAAGRETAQIYVSKPETTLEQPKYELCGFAKTKLLQPGESETLTIVITADDLYSYDTENSRYIIDKGEYKFYAAASAADIRAEANAEIKELRVIYDVENRCVPSPEPAHIIKSEYKVKAERSDDEAIALMKDTSKSGKSYIIDLKESKEIGDIYLTWENLSAPFIISVAGDDKDFKRYDVCIIDGLNFAVVDLHGISAHYIKAEPVAPAALTDVRVFPASADDKQEEFKVYENLALKKPVKSASIEGAYLDKYAVDGNFTSRWGSLPTGQSWLVVDLQEVKQIKGMLLYLEAAWVPYRVEYSNDGESFTTLASLGSGEVFVKLNDLDIEARYVRLIREGENWFSIYEIEIYG
ncbi:MAG: glycoside hydrolase family 3 C-terminal domain-containing protein [Clostridia bacterium]|nr:glycoside hydrolase family 3 C-terminal domain-containing protein [Clostridia bacterium]